MDLLVASIRHMKWKTWISILRVKKVELKLEALTVGVLQSAFNSFSKFTVKNLFLLNNVAGLIMCNFIKKKNPGTEVFFEVFRNF